MKINILLVPCLVSLFLVSCSQDEIEATNYVRDEATLEALISKKQKYYRANNAELKKKFSECRNASKDERNSVECVAAAREGIFL
jgi:hypothetical protein